METKEIVHLSFSKFGGAGIISRILTEQQQILGFNAKHLSSLDFNIRIQPFRQLDVTLKAIVDEYLVNNHEVKTLFSMYRGTKKLNLRGLELNNTLYHFHWTPGLITNKQIVELSKKNSVFWTLHDMNPFTGGCHMAYECKKFEEDCLDCPAVRKQFQKKVKNNYEFKKKFFSESNIILVAPSEWMRTKVIDSKIFKNENIYKINNGINTSNFFNQNRFIDFLNRKQSKILNIGLACTDLTDSRKGAQHAIDWISEWNSTNIKDYEVQLIFKGLNFDKLKTHNLRHKGYSPILGTMKDFYAEIDVFVHLAEAENFPTAVLEAMASGVPVIARNIGGVGEIIQLLPSWASIDNKVDFFNSMNLIDSTSLQAKYSIETPIAVQNKFSSQQMAQNYIDLYKDRVKDFTI